MGKTFRERFVLYETGIKGLALELDNEVSIPMNEALQNGRANYVLFQSLAARCTGLSQGSEGASSDLSEGHEVKAYSDHELHPENKFDLFQTSASSTFGANNNGPKINRMIKEGDYNSALKICVETGYQKNVAYIYTNTRAYVPTVPFRYMIIPTEDVLKLLSKEDPRKISRSALLAKIKKIVRINARDIS